MKGKKLKHPSYFWLHARTQQRNLKKNSKLLFLKFGHQKTKENHMFSPTLKTNSPESTDSLSAQTKNR
jgi:hypothetical protein